LPRAAESIPCPAASSSTIDSAIAVSSVHFHGPLSGSRSRNALVRAGELINRSPNASPTDNPSSDSCARSIAFIVS
jgi:hypothetical protein